VGDGLGVLSSVGLGEGVRLEVGEGVGVWVTVAVGSSTVAITASTVRATAVKTESAERVGSADLHPANIEMSTTVIQNGISLLYFFSIR
jgi:hypothetical protein